MKIKSLIKRLLPKTVKYKISTMLARMPKRGYVSRKKKLLYLIRNYAKYKIVANKNYTERIITLCRKLSFQSDYGFLYGINKNIIFYNNDSIYSNGTLDYCLCVDYSLRQLADISSNEEMKSLFEGLIKSIETICLNKNDKYYSFIRNFIDNKAECLEEALQRILFVNQIAWQTGHRLVGLGRLDKCLERFELDANDNVTIEILERFIKTLHKDYLFKSNQLYGDTGQIIILGGLVDEHHYYSNALTYLFIKALKKAKVPDPKILLRVSSLMPRQLLELAVETIKTGIGSPLLSNDDVIVPRLLEFGYDY